MNLRSSCGSDRVNHYFFYNGDIIFLCLLDYYVSHSKAAVVHGGPGALGTVAAIARELSKDSGVIEPLQTRDSITELLKGLDEVITAHCDKPITLIGHSWGAWLDENNNTLTMDGELLLVILSSVAQQEVENISANVKKGLKMKMKRGELVGFQSCLGYDYDPNDKSISVNETEADFCL